MKKLLYAVTALAIFAGCSKDLNEPSATATATKGNMIELNLIVSPDSRAVFDGDSHITWEKDDNIAVIIGTDQTDDTDDLYKDYGVGSGTLTYNGDNEKPLFSGTVTDIEKEPTADQEFTVYGICPYSAAKSTSAKYETNVGLLETQSPTQDHWDGKADAMIIEPKVLSGTIDSYQSYTWSGYVTYYKLISEPTEIKLAHLFGFGCITFESLPEDLLNEKVNKFTITATGENNKIAGQYTIDLRKNVFDEDFTYKPSSYSYSDVITLKCDGTIALKDYKAWFVAYPGLYDITINITTPNYKVEFKREGLNIQRSRIARPVINFKEATDVYESTTVDLTGGKTWEHNTIESYKENYSAYFISSSKNPVEWGTLADMPKVEYGMTFSLDENNYPGGYDQIRLTTGVGVNAQRLNGSHLKPETGNVAIKSGYPYAGVKCIKVSSGLYTYGDPGSCDISAFIIDKAGVKHQLSQAQHIEANTAGTYSTLTDYYFYADTELAGNVEIVWDNFTYGRAFMTLLSINPAPEINVAESLTIYGQGGEGTIDADILNADNITVESDAEWLKVSYNDGKISYTAAPYDGDELNRKANITITANGFAVATKTIAVSQLSSQYAEYTLTILPDDLTPYLEAAKAEYEAANENATVSNTTLLSFNATLKAVINDGSGITKDVEMYFHKVEYGSTTYEDNNGRYIKLYAKWFGDDNGAIYNLSSVDKVTKIVVGNNNATYNYSYPYVGDSSDAITTKLDYKVTNTVTPYLWESVTNPAEDHGFFKIYQDTGNNTFSVSVTFISKKPEVPGYGDHGDPITSDDGNYNW